MKYQARWNNSIIAEADENQILKIEGNIYFPPNTVNKDYLEPSNHTTQCPWKGKASYYNIIVDGKKNENAAWYYENPKEGSIEIVARDNKNNGNFKNYIAFWNQIDVTTE